MHCSTKSQSTDLPWISVVTPSFNQGKYLEATLLSVLEQDYPRVEYVVMDGGSTDGSVEIIKKYASRLAYWCSAKDNGQADAIAHGFEKSSGEILCWLNSDDLLLPEALRTIGRYFRNHPDADVVNGGAYRIDEVGAMIRKGFGSYTTGVAASYDRFVYYEMDGVFQPATFWRRSSYFEVGGINTELQFIMDRDLFTRMARKKRFHSIPQFVACARSHSMTKSSQLQEIRESETIAFKQQYEVDQLPYLQAAWRYWCFRFGSLVRKSYLTTMRPVRLFRHSGVVN